MSLQVTNYGDSQISRDPASPPRSTSDSQPIENIAHQIITKRERSSTAPSLGQHVCVSINSDLPPNWKEFFDYQDIHDRRSEARKNLNDLNCLMGAIIVTTFFGIIYLVLQSQKKG